MVSEMPVHAMATRAIADCPEQRLTYSVAEASALTGLGRTTLYELMSVGSLRRIKVGKRTLIRHDDLDTLLASDDDRDL